MFLVTRKAGGKTWFLALGREYPYWTPMIETAIQFQAIDEADVYIEEHIGNVMLHKKDKEDYVEICEVQLIPVRKIRITERGILNYVHNS